MSSEEQQPVAATPGVDRLVTVTVNGHTYGYRRPSRADSYEARRRTAARLGGEMHALLDGTALEWECLLEIGLQPQMRGDSEVRLGEHAPEHWFQPILDQEKKVIGRRISFLDVPDDEFSAVCEALREELGKKKPPA